jgi:hypothetical protein
MNTVWIVMGGNDWEGSHIVAVYDNPEAADIRKDKFSPRGWSGMCESEKGPCYDHIWIDTHEVQSVVTKETGETDEQ